MSVALPSTEELFQLADTLDQAPAPPPTVGHAALGGYEAAQNLLQRGETLQVTGSIIGAQAAKAIALERLGEADAELFSIQESLSDLDDERRGKLNTYLGHISKIDPVSLGYTDRVAILANEPLRLKHFLAWHDQHIASQQQSDEFHAAVEAGKRRHIDATEWAVANHWFAPSIISSNQAVEHARVYIGDIWDTTLQGRLGYFRHGGSSIVTTQGVGASPDERYRDIVKKLDHVAGHEYIHLQLNGPAWQPRWVREGGVQHGNMALSDLTDESFATIDPTERRALKLREEGSYIAERKLIATLLKAGAESIDPRTFTVGGSSNGPNNIYWFSLTEALDRSWGMDDTLGRVTRQIEEYEERIRKQSNEDHLAGNLTHPKTIWEIQDEALVAVQANIEARAQQLRNQKPQHHVGTAAMGSSAA